MTESIYRQAKLVQLMPAGEWYVAILHPERPDILAVDTGKNLTFAAEFEPETLATVQPVLALNRFVDLRLEFIPGLFEGSAFNLLVNALYRVITDAQQQASNPQNQLALLTLWELQPTFGQSLHQALTAPPSREETSMILLPRGCKYGCPGLIGIRLTGSLHHEHPTDFCLSPAVSDPTPVA